MGVITPAVPDDFDEFLNAFEILEEQLDITNIYLNYIYCVLFLILISIVVIILWRLIYNTLFKKEIDFF